jgi:RND family efflux transporter MFP subunit
VDVERAELTLSWTKIVAPFNGRVSRIQTNEGSLVIGGQTPILRVIATDPLYVNFSVPEDVLAKLRREGLSEPGKLAVTVGFSLDKDFPHTAKLDVIEPEIDAKTGKVQFRASIVNPQSLLSPGMSARVRLATK